MNDHEESEDGNQAGVDASDESDVTQHASYQQVMLDVSRCAGRFGRLKKVYYHRTDEDDDDELPDDLTEELELQRIAARTGQPTVELVTRGETDLEPVDSVKEAQQDTEDKLDQKELRRKLASLIVKILIERPQLHYYQGFHDVCLTYMILSGPEEALSKLLSLVDSHFQLFMQPTMNETQEFLALIPILAGLHDYRIQDLLEKAEVGTIFALSWVITWFSHVIPDEQDVEQIFLFLQDQDPYMVLHLCVAILLHKKESILTLEPEMSTVHHYLSQIPRKEKLPIKELIEDAKESFERWSPEKLRKKLEEHRKAKRSLQTSSLLRGLVSRIPILDLVASNARTSVIVFVLASVIALQCERWYR